MRDKRCVQLTMVWNLIGLVYDIKHHFQQYFSYIVAVSFIGETGVHRENH